MSWKSGVEALRRAKTRRGRAQLGAFSVEGYRLIERALESKAPLRQVLFTPQALKQARGAKLYDALDAAGICPLDVAPDEALAPFIEGRTFGSVMGLIDTLPSASLETLLAGTSRCQLLILIEVMDPGNLGALSRTAMASGADALIAVGGTDLFHPKAVRTSMGALFDLPTLQVERWEPLLGQLAKAEVQTIGAVVSDGAAPYATPVSPRHALLVGSEAHGLPMPLQARLDQRWTIPMPATIDSYSVNAATAILMYELNRRFWTKN